MKTLTGLLTALLLAAGLMAVTTAPTAAAACSSYSGCVDTTTKATAPKVVAKRRKATVCGTVSAVGSNAMPRGDLRFTVTRNRGKFRWSKVMPYDGGKMCAITKKLKRTGGYTLTISYLPQSGSIFNPSSGAAGFDVGR